MEKDSVVIGYHVRDSIPIISYWTKTPTRGDLKGNVQILVVGTLYRVPQKEHAKTS